MYTPSYRASEQSGTGKKQEKYPQRFEENVGSAGSLTLVLQALLPCALLCNESASKDPETSATDITLIGGTNVSFSPPIEHFLCVLVPLLAHMGINVSAQMRKRGFYPRGGGEVHLSRVAVNSTEKEEKGETAKLLPITLTSQGIFSRVNIYVYVSPEDGRVLEKSKQATLLEAENMLKNTLVSAISDLLSTVSNTVDNIPICLESIDDMKRVCTLPPPLPMTSMSLSQSESESGSESQSAQTTCNTPFTATPRKQETSFTTNTCINANTTRSTSSSNSAGESHKINKNANKKYEQGKKQKVAHGGQQKPGKQQQKSKKVAITLGALVCLHTSTGCVISADAIMNEKDHNKFDEEKSSVATSEIVNTIISRLERTVSSGACIDEQTSDQLLIYMAFAPGTSEILCAPLCESDHSRHIEAAIDIISQFTHRQFVVELDTDTKCRLIRCE